MEYCIIEVTKTVRNRRYDARHKYDTNKKTEFVHSGARFSVRRSEIGGRSLDVLVVSLSSGEMMSGWLARDIINASKIVEPVNVREALAVVEGGVYSSSRDRILDELVARGLVRVDQISALAKELFISE